QAQLLASLDVPAIRQARIKAVVDCAFGPVSLVLPGILGRLGSEILTVNAYVDETRPTLSGEERASHVSELCALVRASRARLGVFFDPTSESIELVTEGGERIPPGQALLVLLDLICSARPGGTVVVPVSASR